MNAAPWTALVVRVPAATEELLIGGLAWCLQGERRIDRPGGEVELWLYLHSSDDEAPALGQAATLLTQAGLDPAGCDLRAEVVEDGRWVERYQESLRPFDIGSRYRVFPSGVVDEPAGDRRPLVLIPGRAFGTGEHPTTRLCTAALERVVTAGSRWVDVGCGTAILSIVARESGAREVLALDNDPEAIAVATDVLAANRVDGVDARVGSATDVAGEWDGVVANISAVFLLEHAGVLARIPCPGGVLVVSGFMDTALERVAAAFEREGLVRVDSATEAPWGLVVLRRRA